MHNQCILSAFYVGPKYSTVRMNKHIKNIFICFVYRYVMHDYREMDKCFFNSCAEDKASKSLTAAGPDRIRTNIISR